MPAEVERTVQALKQEGTPESNAYAIAYSQYNKKKNKKGSLHQLLAALAAKATATRPRQLGASLVSQEGRFASYFLLTGDMINGKGWGVAESSIPDNIRTFVGKPFTITHKDYFPDSPYKDVYDHPTIDHLPFFGIAAPGTYSLQDERIMERWEARFQVGTITDVYPRGNDWYCLITIRPQFRKHAMPPFCSPSILMDDPTEPDDNITKWHGRHLTGLDEHPAYGSIAIKRGECNGTYGSCAAQLKSASAKRPLSIRRAKDKGYVTPCTIRKLAKEYSQISAALTSPSIATTQKLNLYTEKKNDDDVTVPLTVPPYDFFIINERQRSAAAPSLADILIEQERQQVPNPDFFDPSSSFVGFAEFERDTRLVTANLNYKQYTFCDMSYQRFYAWKKAASKGKYFNKKIKHKYVCSGGVKFNQWYGPKKTY